MGIVLDDEAVQEVVRRAERIGVSLTANVEADGSIWLGDLQRDTGRPGSGRLALDMLCELADDHDVAIALTVVEICEPVISIYVDAGFERIDDPDRCEDGFAVMSRQPHP
jgi:hypothetical protein